MNKRTVAMLLAAILTLQLTGCGSLEETSSLPEESFAESSRESASENDSVPEPAPSEEPNPEEPAEPEEPAAPQSSVAAETVSESSAPELFFSLDPSTAKALNPDDITVYVQDLGEYTVSDLSNTEDVQKFASAINTLSAGEQPGTPGAQELGFLLVRDDYTKFQYDLLGSVLRIDEEDVTVSAQESAALRELANATTCGTYAQWLIYMRPTRVQEITRHTKDGYSSFTPGDGRFEQLLEAMRWIGVVRGSGSTSSEKIAPYKPTDNPEYFQIQMRFDSGVVYSVTFDGQTLYIESSDMDFGCRYTMSNLADRDSIYNMVKGEQDEPLETYANPGTGKPVIYLYPEQTQNIEVKLDFKGELCYTFPTYQSGWRVTAQPDGTLTNKADGSTHYYLFWDGNAERTDWDFSAGFVVKGSEVQAFFQEKLPRMGLTPREYNDFITYWTPELARNPYNLITFSTTQYAETARLHVSPAPDTVLRVHMVYKPLDAPIDVKEQILPTAPERAGFTVVEWGGTRAHYPTSKVK